MVEIIIAIIMGAIEGLTEFAPVSSTGHLILAGHLMNFEGDTAKTFEVIIQLGSIMAVVVLYWKRLWSLFGFYRNEPKSGPSHLNLLHIIIAAIPAVILGVLLRDFIKAVLFTPESVVIALVAGGILMIFAERLAARRVDRGTTELSYTQALIIGLFQCLSLWSGFSRSGSTISGGIIAGVERKTAAEFSFILAVPIMIGASGYDLIKSLSFLHVSDIPLFITGFLTAFIVAMLAIVFFLKLLRRFTLVPFAVYRFILAAAFGLFMLL
ncbi:undecaprenyl-diphosphate phosphatase [Sporolactobacillus sp. THM19-2]|uniref:undecaprenyl-diphosphate phosphatase n=1 Tax=Sporolactobacillus sp. THM19-2 TaxID=2511171 RepID=UPI00101ED80B|nr:undecaprenyl-diphosphate phosphatase [Sporolactobacillus sp. THM19-2]RYL87290.1 undecaprenyl-diphosphate phosphatase [Sporolactobacillus sp. THM19-2]